MRIVVTGAGGFLGQRLIRALLQTGNLTDNAGKLQPIEQIRAFDVAPVPAIGDSRVRNLRGDLTSKRDLEDIIDGNTSSVFHLAAVVSGQAEQDFDLGMKVNFDAPRALLEHVRLLGTRPKIVITSSVAVFGGELPQVVDDRQVWQPQSSYGTEKAMTDLLLAEYSRRGYIDGRSLRLPTIVVRPGKPNRAASSFASGIIREPILGEEAVCPVAPESVLWLMSPAQAIRNLILGHELSSEKLTRGRSINLPGLSISVSGMVGSLRRVAGDDVARRIAYERDPAVERIVNSWPGNFSASYARALGFTADEDFDSIVRQFMEENSQTLSC